MNDPWLAIVSGLLPTYATFRLLGTSSGSFCTLPGMCNYVCCTIPYRLQLLKQGNHSVILLSPVMTFKSQPSLTMHELEQNVAACLSSLLVVLALIPRHDEAITTLIL